MTTVGKLSCDGDSLVPERGVNSVHEKRVKVLSFACVLFLYRLPFLMLCLYPVFSLEI